MSIVALPSHVGKCLVQVKASIEGRGPYAPNELTHRITSMRNG